LVNPNYNDFRISANSPCIASGKNNYDIGAYSVESIPEAVTSLEFHDAPLVYITWQNPTIWSDGSPLNALDEIKIYNNELLLTTFNNVQPGEVMHYYDTEILNNEEFRISLVASIDGTDGWPYDAASFRFRENTGYIPYPPENLIAEIQNNSEVVLQWQYANSSLPGAAIPDLFRIYRDEVFLDEIDGDLLIYSDPQLPAIETAYYITGVYTDGIESYASNTASAQAVSVGNDLASFNFQLSNYPNPFNPSTEIRFQTSDFSEIESVEIGIYNLKGQKVKILTPSSCHPEFIEGRGEMSVTWNGTDKNHKPVSSNVYYYKLSVNGKTEAVRKCLLLK
jgi:hypothetical protein